MRFPARLLLSFTLAAMVSHAQALFQRKAASVSAYKLIKITVTGNNRYSAEQIMPVIGLKVGDAQADGDFQQAVQRLGETGLFTDVSFTYSYSAAGTEVVFQVKENDKLVPAKFDNLVWYSDKEWIDKLHALIPLFEGELPISGNL